MSPVADRTCAKCKRPLKVAYEDDPVAKRLSDGSRKALLAKWLQIAIVCTDCDRKRGEYDEKVETKQLTDRLVEESGLPSGFYSYRFDQLRQEQKVIEAVQKWAQQKHSLGIFLWGPVGVGKTRVAATAALQRIMLRREPVRWVSVAHLLARLEQSYYDTDRKQALDVLMAKGALILDDLDKATPSESKRQQLYLAIDVRTVAESPLLVTCNSSPQELEKRLGAPIASRLVGYSLGRVFQLKGVDRRLRVA